MYETFYRLNANPFRLTPDPRFCFSHSGYEQAYAYLQYAFELGEGFIMLTGRPGAGKTTLVETFLGELDEDEAVAARVVVSHQETTDLLRSVAYRFGLEAEGLDKATLLKRVFEFFVQQQHAGRRALLVIDEAQGLSHAALEELRLLADLQEGAHPLLQIFLVGQEALRNVMREPGMEQFQQRVIGSCRLGPMSLAETRSYVEHRLRRAGWHGDPELTGAAVLALYRYSGGVPRHVNKICTRLLFQGVTENKHKLDRDDVVGIGMEMDDEQLSPSSFNPSDVDDAAENAAAVLQSQEGSVTLADLAVRMERATVQRIPVPARMTAGRAPKDRQRSQQQTRRGARPATGGGTPANLRGARAKTGAARRDAVVQRLAVAPVTRRAHAILTTRVLPGVLQIKEKPALLFSAVAALTLSTGAITAFFGHDEEEGRRALYVRDTHSLQSVPVVVEMEKKTATEVVPHRQGPQPELRVVSAPAPSVSAGQKVELTLGRRAGEPATVRTPPVSTTVTPVEPAPVDVAVTDGDRTTNPGGAAVLALASPPGGHRQGQTAGASGSAVAVESSVAATASDGTGDAAVPAGIVATTRTVSEPPVASVARKTEPAVSPSSKNKVTQLLSQGRQALKQDRLLIPSRRSAYHYFRQVLALEPDNWEALYGMDKIVDRYVELTDKAVQRGDEVKARRYIARGLRIRSGEPRLLVLRDRLERASEPVVQTPAQATVQVEEPVVAQRDKPKNVVEWLKDVFSGNAVGPERDVQENWMDER